MDYTWIINFGIYAADKASVCSCDCVCGEEDNSAVRCSSKCYEDKSNDCSFVCSSKCLLWKTTRPIVRSSYKKYLVCVIVPDRSAGTTELLLTQLCRFLSLNYLVFSHVYTFEIASQIGSFLAGKWHRLLAATSLSSGHKMKITR